MSNPFGSPQQAPMSMPMDMSAPPPAPKAAQACLSCRRQKRKCDKALPSCSLCSRMNRACDYSTPTQQPNGEDFMALRQKLHELESRLNQQGGSISDASPYTPATTLSGNNNDLSHQPQSQAPVYIQQDPAFVNVQNRFPAIAFLDSEAFKYGQISVPKAMVEIPVEVLEILGDGAAVQAVINDYFASIHTWLPIISKKRMDRNMINPMWEAGPDLALLFLSMKLMITRTQEGLESPQNYIYLAAKRFLSLMECSGMTSLLVLQSYVLVSLYELAHAIYPGAWMTAGASVRYGLLLGVNDHADVPSLLERVTSWTEVEERKRTWWAVLIMDRAVSLGGQGRSFASEDPDPSTVLPCDTNAWDEGEMVPSPILGTSSTYAEPRSPFARLCQASILLGKVVRHHYMPLTPEIHQFHHASELYHEASELTRLLTRESEESSDYLLNTPALAICFSAISTLCDPYACVTHHTQNNNTPEESAMQVQAVEGIKSVSTSVKEMSVHVTERSQSALDIDRCSPFIFDALYAAAANFAWIARESGDPTSAESLEVIRQCLRQLGGRWKASSEYVRVLEAQGFTYAVGNVGSSGAYEDPGRQSIKSE